MFEHAKPNLFVTAILCLVAAGLEAHAVGISYPALGNFRTEEGTLEIWLTPLMDPNPEDVGQFRSAFGLFGMRVPGHFGMAGS